MDDHALANPEIRDLLEALETSLRETFPEVEGLNVIVTGGDRYVDADGNVRSSSDDQIIISDAGANSQHVFGDAIDIFVTGIALNNAELAVAIAAAGFNGQFQVYPPNTEGRGGHIHISVRPPEGDYSTPTNGYTEEDRVGDAIDCPNEDNEQKADMLAFMDGDMWGMDV